MRPACGVLHAAKHPLPLASWAFSHRPRFTSTMFLHMACVLICLMILRYMPQWPLSDDQAHIKGLRTEFLLYERYSVGDGERICADENVIKCELLKIVFCVRDQCSATCNFSKNREKTKHTNKKRTKKKTETKQTEPRKEIYWLS